MTAAERMRLAQEARQADLKTALKQSLFEWAQAIRHHEDATMKLLHGQQSAAADECRRMATKLRKLME